MDGKAIPAADRVEDALQGLYRSVIMEHYRSSPRRGTLAGAQVTAEGKNRLCGDDVRLRLRLRNGTVEAARFEGTGCALSLASASMLAERIEGGTLEQARALIDAFTRFVKGEGVEEGALGDLAAFEGVRKFPVRVKCVLLPFMALREALPQGK